MKLRFLFSTMMAFAFVASTQIVQAATLQVGDVDLKYLPANETYAVDVSFKPSQFQAIYNSGRKIQMRYYAEARDFNKAIEKHNPRKLGEYDIENNRSAKASRTLPKRDLCPARGHYVAKVWFDVKFNNGSNDADYDKAEYQGSYAQFFPYTCYDDRAEEITFERSHFPEFGVSADGKQLNFKAWIDESIYNAVTSRGGDSRFEVRFYAFHAGQRIPLFESRSPYKVNQRKMGYTLSATELCYKVMEWWESKVDVSVGLELRAIHSDGNESWSFSPYVTPAKDRTQVTCVN